LCALELLISMGAQHSGFIATSDCLINKSEKIKMVM